MIALLAMYKKIGVAIRLFSCLFHTPKSTLLTYRDYV